MNRKPITRTMLGALAAFVAVAAIGPAHAADAPPAQAAANDVSTIAAGLEAPDAATRAKAAETLGTRYPEAAAAVPVLLDATRDEDAAVRTAAVRALRLLGRRGQEDAAKAWTTMSAADLALVGDALAVACALGSGCTPTDLAHLLIETLVSKPTAAPAALHLLALIPVRSVDREFAMRVALRDGLETLSVASPFLASKDAATMRAAAAVVTMLGRSAVAAPFGAAPEDDTASASALVPLLSAASPAVQFAGWRLVACGAPHSFRTAMTVVKLAAALPAGERSLGDDPKPAAPDRSAGEVAARSLGTAASSFLTEGVSPGDVHDDEGVRRLVAAGAKNLARDVWRAMLGTWIGPRHERRVSARVVFAFGEDAELTSFAAKSVPRLVDTERAESEASRALLAPPDAKAPADTIPQETPDGWREFADPSVANPSIALAWLAHRAPATEMDKGLLARLASALRRALVTPNRLADRGAAAAVILDLAKPDLVPSATLLAALQADGTKADPLLETVVLAALAVGSVPDAGLPLLTPFATTPATGPVIAPEERTRIGDLLPLLTPALAMKADGAWAEVPALRRLAAIDALGAVVGDKAKAKEVLVPLTKDPDARVRYRAAKALRRLGP